MACGGCSSDKTYTVQLVKKVAMSAQVDHYEFKALETFHWQEGSHAELLIPLDGEMLGQAFPIVSLAEEGKVTFAISKAQENPDYDGALASLAIGALVEVAEPCGDFMLKRDERPILLLSKEEGMTYYRSMVKAFEASQKDIGQLIQINLSEEVPLYKASFDELAKRLPCFKSFYVTDDQAFYRKVAFESQALMALANQIPYFYIQGEGAFVQAVVAYLLSVGMDQGDMVTATDQSEDGCSGCSGGGCSGCSDK